jgi:hypothetical protein
MRSPSKDIPTMRLYESKSALQRSRNMILVTIIIAGILLLVEVGYNSYVVEFLAKTRSGRIQKFMPIGLLILAAYLVIIGIPGVPVTRVKVMKGKGLLRLFGSNKFLEIIYYVIVSVVFISIGTNIIEPSYLKTLTEHWAYGYDVALIDVFVRQHMNIYYCQLAAMFAVYNIYNILGVYQYSVELEARIGPKIQLFKEEEYF